MGPKDFFEAASVSADEAFASVIEARSPAVLPQPGNLLL